MNIEKNINEEKCNAVLPPVSNNGGIDDLVCPKCKGRDLKYKSYLMFGKVCCNCGSYVKLPTHPDYGK
jgi:hypothetical protein